MTRLIHTGDTHIGYRQYHTPERREDFLAAFRQVLEDAVADDVDAVVHAGDLFHDRRPGLGDILGTMDALRIAADADVPVLAIVGNHEAKREGQWLDLFERMGLAERLGTEGRVVGDVTLYGLDYVPRSRRDDLELSFDDPETDHAALVAHGLFEPFPHGEWDTESLLTDADVDFDALLLGDNHHPDRAEVAGAWVTYCGSTERVSAAEREDRGYNLVTFDDGVELARRGLDVTRDFRFVDVELAPGEGIDRVRDAVAERELEDAVVIVSVEGDGEPVDVAAVESFATERGAIVARVTDRRELQDAEDVDVQFADPDAAVRERLRDLGLSEAARTIDEAVRDGTVADANVRETVETRVRELVEADPTALEPADEPAEPEGDEPAEPDAEDPADPAEETSVEEPEEPAEEKSSEEKPSEPEPEDPSPSETEAPSDGAEAPTDDEREEPGAEPEEPPAEESEPAPAGQASMEEYL